MKISVVLFRVDICLLSPVVTGSAQDKGLYVTTESSQ